MTAEYSIRVPRDSKLEVTQDNGYVWVSDVTGDIQVHSHTGDMIVMLPDTGSICHRCQNRNGHYLLGFCRQGPQTVTWSAPTFPMRAKRRNGESICAWEGDRSAFLTARLPVPSGRNKLAARIRHCLGLSVHAVGLAGRGCAWLWRRGVLVGLGLLAFSARFIRGIRHAFCRRGREPIAYPWFRQDVFRLGGIRLDLLAQLVNKNPQILGLIAVIGSPHGLQQFAVRNGLARPAKQDSAADRTPWA